MKLTVIIPVYNVKDYLEECIDSVVNQTYNNFEIVIVDDGSTDGSEFICELYKQKYPGIVRVFHNSNRGVLVERVYGIKQAKGDIIIFLDSDDCLRKDSLKIINDIFEEEKCDMVLFELTKNKNFIKGENSFNFKNYQIFNSNNKKDVYKQIINSSASNSICLKATKREIFDTEKNYSKFSFVKHGEDLLQSLQIVTDAKKIVYLDEPLYFYRQRESSAVHTFDKSRYKSIKAVHQEIEKYIDLWGVPEYHPLHYAREVRGWSDSLLLHFESEAVSNKILSELANDEYFRNAYEKMNPDYLQKKQRFLAKLLYERKYTLLKLCFNAIKILKSVRHL